MLCDIFSILRQFLCEKFDIMTRNKEMKMSLHVGRVGGGSVQFHNMTQVWRII
jgi:hypothetical protein